MGLESLGVGVGIQKDMSAPKGNTFRPAESYQQKTGRNHVENSDSAGRFGQLAELRAEVVVLRAKQEASRELKYELARVRALLADVLYAAVPRKETRSSSVNAATSHQVSRFE